MSASGRLSGLVPIGAPQVGTGASGVLEFSSIPAGYRALIVELVGRSDAAAAAASARLTFETSPTAGAYDHQLLTTFGATLSASENVGASDWIALGFVPAGTSSANLHAAIAIELPEYANTGILKPVRVVGSGLTNLAANGLFTTQVAGVWESTAAIDRVRLVLASGNWTTSTVARLYGLM